MIKRRFSAVVARRRHPIAPLLVIVVALLGIAAVYAVVNATTARATTAASETLVTKGSKLFAEGCSSCHGLNAQGSSDGPSLVGAGAASVHFQVATGRMPLAAPTAQAMRKPAIYTEEEIQALAAYVSTFGPGPAIPSQAQVDGWKTANIARGGELFRANCAQCHHAAGSGGALTNGKYAPGLMEASPLEIYEAMLTGPQSMPVFSDASLPLAEKQQIIAYIEELKANNNPGGFALGRLGPVTEGLFIWTIGLGAVIAAAVWIGAKVR